MAGVEYKRRVKKGTIVQVVNTNRVNKALGGIGYIQENSAN